MTCRRARKKCDNDAGFVTQQTIQDLFSSMTAPRKEGVVTCLEKRGGRNLSAAVGEGHVFALFDPDCAPHLTFGRVFGAPGESLEKRGGLNPVLRIKSGVEDFIRC